MDWKSMPGRALATVGRGLRSGYRRWPRQTVSAAAVLAAVVAGIVLLHARGGGDDATVRVTRHEAGLAGRIIDGDWQAQLEATRTVLVEAGVTVLDDSAPVPDRGAPYVIAPEVVMLAMDGARKESSARMTLADVAQMLADFGFPFPDHGQPPELLEAGFRGWIAAALEDPAAPGASAARFLHAMAARQRPALDLASADWMAAQYTLTHLELFVFLAAVSDVFPHADAPVRATATAPAAVDRLLGLAFAEARAATPVDQQCALAGKYYGDPAEYDRNKKNMQTIFGWGQGPASGADGALGGAAKAAGALSALFKLHKLMMLYSSIDMRLTASPHHVHKAAGDEPDQEVVFQTTVGIDEEKYREFVERMNSSDIGKSITECLAAPGLPTPTDLGDIVEEMRNWDVSWDLYGDHATWSNKKNRFKSGNLRRAPLEPVSDTHGGARFIVDIKRESHHEGDIVTGYISAKATLHSDAMPGTEVASAYAAALGALQNGDVIAGLLGITGNTVGLTGNLLSEVLTGWARRLLDPDVSFIVAVTEHRHRYPGYSYEGTVTASAVTNVHDVKQERSKESRGGHGFLRSTTTVEKQATAEMRATELRPERMSYTRFTERRDTAYWTLSGPSQTALSFRMSHTYAGMRGCATTSGRVHFSNRTSGSGSLSIPGTYRIRLEQTGSRDDGYLIQIQGSASSGYVPYEQTRTTMERNQGCEFLGPGHEDSKTRREVAGMGLAGFSHSYAIDEPYPETISGQTEVRNGDNSTTHWTWNFRRVGPIDDATGRPGGT